MEIVQHLHASREWLWGWELGFKICSCPSELILGLRASNLIKYKNHSGNLLRTEILHPQPILVC